MEEIYLRDHQYLACKCCGERTLIPRRNMQHKKGCEVTKDFEGLTERQKQVAFAIASGLHLKAAANKLGVSLSTFLKHRTDMFNRLNLNNSVELIHLMYREGLLPLHESITS